MVYTGTIVTILQQQFMAGENVNATGNIEANHNDLAAQVEAYLSSLVKYDIVGNWASLNATYKILFTEYAARYCGMSLITFNMATYTTRTEAEDMINIHVFRLQQIQKILEDSSIQDFQGV